VEELSPYAKSLLALIIVLAAIWAIYALLRYAAKASGRWQGLAGASEDGMGKPRVISRHAVMPGGAVTVLEYGAARYVVYSAGAHLLLLDKLPAPDKPLDVGRAL